MKSEASNKLTIGFINPPHADWALVNPLTLFLCKSHYQRNGKYKDQVVWLESPYKWNSYETADEAYQEVNQADVIMFSSYFWNYQICDEIAKLAKRDNITTILGGPHIGTNEPEFLKSRDYYDYICSPTKPGEVFMEDFIDQWFETNGNVDREKVSWEINSKNNKSYRIDQVEYSVYEDNVDYLKKILDYAKYCKLEPFAALETTRGCPYSCVFCEWGGGISSKIYKKPTDVVKRDILAMKEAGFFSATLTDANFGVFKERDIDILKFAWDNQFNMTDISTVKTKDIERRKQLVDSWFDVIQSKPESDTSVSGDHDMWEKTKHMSILPTVSIQSVSEEAMKVAHRVDLKLEDKIELSRYIGEKTRQAGYTIPALELILAMPGSTLEDFYKEMEVVWNFRAWGFRRHDYMILPDSELANKNYLERHKIKLVEVFTDNSDESVDAAEPVNGIYKNRKSYFKTVIECYSYTHEQFLEMVFMSHAASFILRNLYPEYESQISPSEFAKMVYQIVKKLDGFKPIYKYLQDLYDPNTPPRNISLINGIDRVECVEILLEDNVFLIKNEVALNVLLNR